MPTHIKGLYKQGNIWWYAKQVDYVRKPISLKTKDRNEAIQRALDLSGSPDILSPASFNKELAEYLSSQVKAGRISKSFAPGRRYVLERFSDDFRIRRPEDIKISTVQAYYDKLRADGLKEGTAQGYIYSLRAFLGWLVKQSKLRENVAKQIELDVFRSPARKEFIQKKKITSLIDKCKDDDLKFIMFCGFHAGMRKNEIIEARPIWFDLKQKCVTIDHTPTFRPKDMDRRTIPLSKKFIAFLRRYGKKSPFMLRPEVDHGRARYRWDFKRPMSDYMTSQKTKCNAHMMRHSFTSNLLIEGVDIFRVATWLGDDVRVVQKHYAHLLPHDKAINRPFD